MLIIFCLVFFKTYSQNVDKQNLHSTSDSVYLYDAMLLESNDAEVLVSLNHIGKREPIFHIIFDGKLFVEQDIIMFLDKNGIDSSSHIIEIISDKSILKDLTGDEQIKRLLKIKSIE